MEHVTDIGYADRTEDPQAEWQCFPGRCRRPFLPVDWQREPVSEID